MVVSPQHHQAVWSEQRVQGLREGVGERCIGPVGRPKPAEHVGLELRLRRRRAQPLKGRLDLHAATLARQGQERRFRGALAQPQLRQVPLTVHDPRVVRLGEVVIVARDPEDRNDGHTTLTLEPAGERDRRKRLVDRVQGTREQPRLLTGGDGEDGSLGETLAARSRQRRRDHRGRDPARRNPPLRHHERREQRRDDPRYHASPVSPNTCAWNVRTCVSGSRQASLASPALRQTAARNASGPQWCSRAT